MTDASSAHGSIHLASSRSGARSDQPFPKFTAMSAKSHRLRMRNLEVATRQPEDADASENEVEHLRELLAASQEHNVMLQEERDKALVQAAVTRDSVMEVRTEMQLWRQQNSEGNVEALREELRQARSELRSKTSLVRRTQNSRSMTPK